MFCDEKINFKKQRGKHFKEKRNCQSQNVSSGAEGIKKEFSGSPFQTSRLSRPQYGFWWLMCWISHRASQSLYCYRGKVDRTQAITVWVPPSRATTQISRFLEESSPTPPKHDQERLQEVLFDMGCRSLSSMFNLSCMKPCVQYPAPHKPAWWHMAIRTLERRKQESQKFKVFFGYTASSRPA